MCIPWSRGIGKSWYIRLIWYLLVQEWEYRHVPGASEPGVRIVLLMPTLTQAKRNHAHLVTAEIEGQWAHLGGKFNRTDWRITFPGGSWIQWVSAENAESNRGLRCDVLTIDEADDVDKHIVDSVTAPWFSEPHSLRIRLISGTPRRGRHGLLYHAWKTLPGLLPHNHFAFHATAYDAPLIVDPAYLAEIKRITPPAIFAREWMCDPDAAEGNVYPMFDAEFHVREPSNAMWSEILIGADHGATDPGVLLTIGVRGHGRDAECHVIDEVYETKQDPSWWIEQVKKIVRKYPDAKFFADPSRLDITIGWKRVGAKIQDVDNSIEAGVDAVANKLVIRELEGEPVRRYASLYVSPKCKNLIREFGLYRRKRNPRNPEEILESIVDKDNHCMDSLRYPILSRFGGPDRTRRVLTDTAFKHG